VADQVRILKIESSNV